MNGTIPTSEEAEVLIGQLRRGELTGDDEKNGLQRLQAFSDSVQSHVVNEGNPEQRLNWAERFGNDLEKRGVMLQDIMEATFPGKDGVIEQGYYEGVLQTIGKVGAGAFIDFIGETLISGGRGLSAITPDQIKKPLLNAATTAGHAFLNSDVGKAGLKAATSGIENWIEFKADHPRAARNIESVVNIGMLLMPVKGKPKIIVGDTVLHPAPAKGGTWLTEFGHAGEEAIKRGLTSETKRKAAYIDDLVLELPTKAVLEARVRGTVEKWRGLTSEYILNPFEKSMAKEVAKIPGVSPKNTYQGNHRIIDTAVSNEAKKLTGLLKEHDVPVSAFSYRKVLVQARNKLAENPLIVGDAAKTAEKIIDRAWKLAKPAMEKGKLSAGELLKVRKSLDEWVTKQKGTKIFGDAKETLDPGLETAMTAAVRSVRTSINELVIARSANVGVKESLAKQHILLTALDRVKAKAAKEGANILWRIWKKFQPALTARGQATQSFALLTGVGGLGAASMFAPSITTMAGVGAAAYLGARTLTSPKLKFLVGNILKGVDDLMKKASDPSTILELRADKAFLLEILKSAEETSLREKSGSP